MHNSPRSTLRFVLNAGILHPKGKCDSITQYRPISLGNVVYKVISKMLENRLKKSSQILLENQSAFVPGRHITDNILLAYECVHKIKKKRTM
jgi:hypothetical protein